MISALRGSVGEEINALSLTTTKNCRLGIKPGYVLVRVCVCIVKWLVEGKSDQTQRRARALVYRSLEVNFKKHAQLKTARSKDI